SDLKRLAPRARMSMMARSRDGSTNEAEDTTAVRLVVQRPGSLRIATTLRARQGPSAASGGALRAALTRAHAVASVQLCDEGTPSSPITSIGGVNRAFYLTEESRYDVRQQSVELPHPRSVTCHRRLD